MKRVVLSLVGTVGGLVALLSFKTQSHPVASGVALPSASLPSSAAGATTPASGSSTGSPAASSGGSSGSTAPAQTTRQYLGGAVSTRYGVVQVKIAVTGSKITDVSFAQLTAFDPRSQEINSQAGPYLLKETLDAQSANIDTVSGATYTSDGYRQSLQSALDAAGIP